MRRCFREQGALPTLHSGYSRYPTCPLLHATLSPRLLVYFRERTHLPLFRGLPILNWVGDGEETQIRAFSCLPFAPLGLMLYVFWSILPPTFSPAE